MKMRTYGLSILSKKLIGILQIQNLTSKFLRAVWLIFSKIKKGCDFEKKKTIL